jgi:hypothetical protein
VRLKSLTLRNFAAFGDKPSTIEFAPMTLLFGPNSSGKSSVIKALHYLRSVLVERELDPLAALDGRVDLGGFGRLLHRHDHERTMHLALRVETEDDFESDIPLDPFHPTAMDVERSCFGGAGLHEFAVRLEVRWSHIEHQPFVSAFESGANGQKLARLRCSPDLRRVEIEAFNVQHPAIAWLRDEGVTLEDVQLGAAYDLGMWSLREGPDGKPEPARVEDWSRLVRMPSREGALPPADWSTLTPLLGEQAPSLPTIGLDALLGDGDFPADRPRTPDGLELLVTECLIDPFVNARRAIEDFIHLGPLRGIPQRYQVHRATTASADWWDGTAAWSAMAAGTDERLRELNQALGEGELDAGLAVHVARLRQVPETGLVALALKRGALLDDTDEVRAEFEALPQQVRVQLVDDTTGIVLEPSEVGVGMAQVLPILSLALLTEAGFATIEQPELHIHPAQQVELAEVLARSATEPDRTRVFFLETHSEHMVLRLLRLIRQASEGEAPPGALALQPSDVAVHCIDRGPDGARIWRLRLDEDGEFIDPWPRGFFEERARELFE